MLRRDRTSRRLAASYRKLGYQVAAPPAPEALPEFLRDCHPDMIAEKDDDHVVVEIKAAGTLKGANDLVDLAERVAGQSGWRLELVTFRDPDADRKHDAGLGSPAWLSQMLHAPGEDTLNNVYRLEVLSFLLRGLALQADIRPAGKPEQTLARELAFAGWIDECLLARIEAVFSWRNDLMHRRAPTSPTSVEQVAHLAELCHDVLAQVPTEAAK
jgi:hypothetical protein